MRLRRCTIERFKKFDPPGVEIDFRNAASGAVADRYLILGDNASGKTTILQAAALTLALAQRKVGDVRQFGWTGWAADRLFAHGEPRVELEVEFEEDEIAATREAARRWWDIFHPTHAEGFRAPGDSRIVKLRLEGANVRSLGHPEEMYQFQGRSYVAQGAKTDPRLRDLFPRLPGVFWYDQFRNIALSGARESHGNEGADKGFGVGVTRLDEILKTWHRTREETRPAPGA